MAEDPTILLVDDEEDVVDAYNQGLSKRYTTRTAWSGEAALEQIDETVDVVLLDRRMPGLNGDEVLERIRERGIDCRVVMVTAVDPDIDIITMEFDEYLVKPVSTEELEEVIERMLQRESLDERIERIITVGTKLATLEAKLDYEQLQNSTKYNELREEFKQLRNTEQLAEHEDDPYLEATVENIEALLRNAR